jgi:hypothetical protein
MATTPYAMKMTMHIDDVLLENVIRLTGASSKTEAVHMALREMDRKARLAAYGRSGIGLTSAELMDAIEPGYDVLSARIAEPGADMPSVPPVSRPISYRDYIRRRRNR